MEYFKQIQKIKGLPGRKAFYFLKSNNEISLILYLLYSRPLHPSRHLFE